MKLVLIMLTLLFSTTLLAKGVDETIADIENEKGALCEFISSGSSYCLNSYCRQSLHYTCISTQENDFKLKLNIRYYQYNGRVSNVLVKRVTYFY